MDKHTCFLLHAKLLVGSQLVMTQRTFNRTNHSALLGKGVVSRQRNRKAIIAMASLQSAQPAVKTHPINDAKWLLDRLLQASS